MYKFEEDRRLVGLQSIVLKLTPIIVCLLCWSAVTLSYFLSINEGFIEACLPHISGCTSISKTGRYGSSFFSFKAFMMPAASLMLVYWILVYQWIRTLKGVGKRLELAILILGVLSAVFLIVYVTFLGSEGETYKILRSYGTNLFFLFSFAAYVMIAFVLKRRLPNNRHVLLLIVLCLVIAVDGLSMAILKQFIIDHGWLENSTEWRAATILSVFPVLVWLLWKETKFEVRFSTGE